MALPSILFTYSAISYSRISVAVAEDATEAVAEFVNKGRPVAETVAAEVTALRLRPLYSTPQWITSSPPAHHNIDTGFESSRIAKAIE